jgi:Flp pilus assembly pilin Flp
METTTRQRSEFCSKLVRRALVDERGSTFAEFGLVFLVVAAIVFVMAIASGGGSLSFFQHVNSIE